MDLTHQLLSPILQQISDILAAQPGHLEKFEAWANAQSLRLRRAADQGLSTLAYEAELLRAQQTWTRPVDPLEACKQLWLAGLIELVDDLLEDKAPEEVPWKTDSDGASHHL